MMLWELENSDNILDRQKYVERIKTEFIPMAQKELDIAMWSGESGELEKRFLKNLKIRITNYDIYRQNLRCPTCHEVECVCDEFQDRVNKLL